MEGSSNPACSLSVSEVADLLEEEDECDKNLHKHNTIDIVIYPPLVHEDIDSGRDSDHEDEPTLNINKLSSAVLKSQAEYFNNNDDSGTDSDDEVELDIFNIKTKRNISTNNNNTNLEERKASSEDDPGSSDSDIENVFQPSAANLPPAKRKSRSKSNKSKDFVDMKVNNVTFRCLRCPP